jgi:hypothetical protein
LARVKTHREKEAAKTPMSQHARPSLIPRSRARLVVTHTRACDMLSLQSSISLTRRPSAGVARTSSVRATHRRGNCVVTCAFGKKDKPKRSPKGPAAQQGDLEKKRCDLCLGSGIRKCYGCHVAEGWRADNFSTSKCERAGYVPIKIGGFLGIGGKDDEAKCSVCWTDPAKKPGTVRCARCKGTKYIYYRNADWR